MKRSPRPDIPVMPEGVPAVTFSAHALADLDLLAKGRRRRADAALLRALVEASVAALPWHSVCLGAYRVLYDRWLTVVDGMEVVYDILSSDKVMVIGLRRI